MKMTKHRQSHDESSIAFFMRPFLRFVKVTWRLRSSAMRSMRIFLRPTARREGREEMAGTGRSVESEGGGANERGFRIRAGRTARQAFDPMVESVERAGDALAVDLTGGDGVDPLDLAAALALLGGLPMIAVASHGSG